MSLTKEDLDEMQAFTVRRINEDLAIAMSLSKESTSILVSGGPDAESYVARFTPDVVIREAEMKIALFNLFGSQGEASAHLILKILAYPYCDHADYKKSWEVAWEKETEEPAEATLAADGEQRSAESPVDE